MKIKRSQNGDGGLKPDVVFGLQVDGPWIRAGGGGGEVSLRYVHQKLRKEWENRLPWYYQFLLSVFLEERIIFFI